MQGQFEGLNRLVSRKTCRGSVGEQVGYVAGQAGVNFTKFSYRSISFTNRPNIIKIWGLAIKPVILERRKLALLHNTHL